MDFLVAVISGLVTVLCIPAAVTRCRPPLMRACLFWTVAAGTGLLIFSVATFEVYFHPERSFSPAQDRVHLSDNDLKTFRF
jgi:hypothetical protein